MKTAITVRIDSGLLADARQCARDKNRTLTNFIETVLRQRVSERTPVVAPPRSADRSSMDEPRHVA